MDLDTYVFVNCRILKLIGLYPMSITRWFGCASSTILIVVPQVVLVYYQRNDFGVVLETCSVLLTILLALLKLIVWVSKAKTINALVCFMFTDYWSIAKISDSANHIVTYAASAQYITKCYLLLIFNALLFFFSLPLIEIFLAKAQGSFDSKLNKHFPFTAIYPQKCYEFPYFEIVYLSQMIATCICGAIILGTDTLIATALLHTCGHFKVLQQNLENLSQDFNELKCLSDHSERKEEIEFVITKKITFYIKHHEIIIRFAEIMEEVFSPIMFLQVLASNLIICLVGFQVSTTWTDWGKMIKYFSYLMMALFQLLLFCWPGNDLIVQSGAVSDAAYAINWYEASRLVKKEIQLIVMRGQKENRITACKFYVMCLENFSAVLCSSLSYFTMLRSFN